MAFCLLAEQVLALHSNKELCPDRTLSKAFVLASLELTADDIVELVSGASVPA